MELVDMINNWKHQPWAREMGFSNDCQSSNTCPPAHVQLALAKITDTIIAEQNIKWQHTATARPALVAQRTRN